MAWTARISSSPWLLAYPWSSFGAYLAAPAHRSGWIQVDRLLGERGIVAEDLKRRRKSDRDKLEIGARLRQETTLTIKAIAAQVHLGSTKSANGNLHRHMASHQPKPLRNVRRRASGRSRA